jgi:preprotein translocase subunit SecA
MVGEDTAFRAQFVRQREIIEAVGQSKSVLPSSPNCESPDVVEAFPLSPPPRKVGRNQECPCGSGKKYKKCCGR